MFTVYLGNLGGSDVLCTEIPGGSLGGGATVDRWTEMPGGSLGGPDMSLECQVWGLI